MPPIRCHGMAATGCDGCESHNQAVKQRKCSWVCAAQGTVLPGRQTSSYRMIICTSKWLTSCVIKTDVPQQKRVLLCSFFLNSWFQMRVRCHRHNTLSVFHTPHSLTCEERSTFPALDSLLKTVTTSNTRRYELSEHRKGLNQTLPVGSLTINTLQNQTRHAF